MISRIVLFSGAIAIAALGAGCGSAKSGGPGAKRQVVAAFYPVAYAAEQIAAPTIEVRNLTPAGAEPHDLELTPGTCVTCRPRRLVLYLGEGFMPGLETAVAERHGRSIDLLAGQRLRPGSQEDGCLARPSRLARSGALCRHEPDDRRGARRRRGGRRTGSQARSARCVVPRRPRTLCAAPQIVTSHAAFAYLAARYGLEQIPLAGLAPEAEPSARSLAHLVEMVRRSGATTVFFETLVSPKLAETVAREAGVSTAVLDPLEGLTGAQQAAGADYFTVMRANLVALRKALGCRP